MATLITDPLFEAALLEQRQANGADRHDEVWEGVYWMAPQPNNEHQDLVGELTSILRVTVDWEKLGRTLPGTNITNQATDWTHNYRCPDVAVFLNETAAENRDTHWLGGPDLAIEIVSEGDRTREKFDFYAAVGTRELLIVDRFPWALQLFRLQNGRLKLLREIEALRESGQITEDERVERLREAFPAEPGRGSDSDFVRFDRYSCRQNTGDQSPHSFK